MYLRYYHVHPYWPESRRSEIIAETEIYKAEIFLGYA